MKNFGQIKNHIVNRFTKAYVNKTLGESNELKTFLTMVKESDILRTEFAIYRNLEAFSNVNEITGSEFLKGNIALMESFKKEDIMAEHMKLAKSFGIEEFDAITDEKLNGLYESITNLIFLENSISTVSTIAESTSTIVGYFKTNVISENKETKIIDSDLLKSVSKDKIKERYEDKLSPEELAIVETIVKGDASKQEALLKDMVKECIGYVNTNISEANVDGKEKLLNVKASLLDIEYMSETFKDDAKRVLSLLSGFKKG